MVGIIGGTKMSDGNNREAIREQMFKEVETLGETEGRGATSRAVCAVKMVEFAANGAADVTDAEMFYDRYMGRSAHVQAAFGGGRKQGTEESGRKQNVSKFRQFLKMGTNKRIDPVALIYEAQATIKEERAKGTIKFAPFDAMLNIAREQCKPDNVDEAIGKEHMIMCNQPKEKPDRSTADRLFAAKQKLEKINEDDPQDLLSDAIECIDTLISDLGGTTADAKKAERERKKAEKEAAANA